jgi:hypothetical protein
MFKNEFDVTVGFLTNLDSYIEVSEVSGSGLMIKAVNHKTDHEVSFALNHEEVIKLNEVLVAAEKYIKENK